MSRASRLTRWLSADRKWFVIGDLSPFRGPGMLITGPLIWRHARREARHWVAVHPFGQAAVVQASEEIATLPRWILRDYA